MALFLEGDDWLGGPLSAGRFTPVDLKRAPLSHSARSVSAGHFGSNKRHAGDKHSWSGLGQISRLRTATTTKAVTSEPTRATYTQTSVAPAVDEQEATLLSKMRSLITTAAPTTEKTRVESPTKVRVDAQAPTTEAYPGGLPPVPEQLTPLLTPSQRPEQKPTQDLIMMPGPGTQPGTSQPPQPAGMGPQTLVAYQPSQWVPDVGISPTTKWLIGGGVAVAALITAAVIFRR